MPNWLQCAFGFGLILLSLSHWFPLGIWPLELLGAFAHFTATFCILVLIAALLLRLYFLTGSAFLSLVLNAALVTPHFASIPSSVNPHFTIAQFNVYHNNPTADEAIQFIANTNPDVFTIQELNTHWSESIDSIFSQSHSYTVKVPSENCCHGIGFYSKFPITSYEVLDIEKTPVIVAHVLINHSELTLISLHTRPPVFPNETDQRNTQLRTVAEIARTIKNPIIVLGDFNIVPWDSEFKDFLLKGNLKVAHHGFQATFPMEFGFPLIPIDHITYSDKLVPTSCQTVTIPGSDHHGLVAGFTFKD